MSIEYTRRLVLREAQAEAERIESEARAKADATLSSRRREAESEYARRLERAQEEIRQECERAVMQRRAEHNLALLKRRNEILDALFEQAGQQVARLPDDQYCALVGEWLHQVPADAGGELLCGAQDRKRLAPLVRDLNAGRPAGAQLTLRAHDQPVTGGVVFRGDKFEMDLTLDARLRMLRETLAPDVARIAFSGELTV